MAIEHPYLLFLGDVKDPLAVKTARGILDWRREWVAGQLRLPGHAVDLGVPDLTPQEAAAAGVKTMVIGVANPGGTLPEPWVATIIEALDAGLDVANGLHMRLAGIPAIAEAASRSGRRLFDVRHSTQNFSVGNGRKRPGKRLLTIGTDANVGKKYTALALEREMRAHGLKADFRATGQTGILIAGTGVAVDAVVADFISGAAEWLSPANDPDHWDVIEGQGSLFHPAFAGVTLGLLHGSQPDAFVVCHEPTRTTMRHVDAPVPDIDKVIDATLRLGRWTNPAIQCIGLSINTSGLPENEVQAYLQRLEAEHGLPAVDPMRTGVRAIVDNLEESPL